MKLNKDTKILIVGLGVIGGGYAKSLFDQGYDVSCITKNQADIDYAIENKIISYGTTEIDAKLISESKLIIFALYPSVFIEWIKSYKHLFSAGTVITDVSGVKSSVVYTVEELLSDIEVEFIAHHPMAGREKSGVEYSTPDVFRGANFIITPTKKSTQDSIEIIRSLGKALGFKSISELTPEKHDSMIAFLSQLTHAIAVALMNANQSEGLEKYTGDSFRDLTRIAKINDRMWSELFELNKESLLLEMDAFINKFSEIRSLLAAGDTEGIRKEMRAASKRRELFDKPI